MNKYAAGVISGFVATTVLSVMMVIKAKMGMLPKLNVIFMLAHMAHQKMGAPASPAVGWMLHYMIGTVIWGLAFAALFKVLPPGKAWQKGIVFGVIAWVLMMIGPMPMAGAGLFGLKLSIAAPIMTLVLHILFGAVLGGVYYKLIARSNAQQTAQQTA